MEIIKYLGGSLKDGFVTNSYISSLSGSILT